MQEQWDRRARFDAELASRAGEPFRSADPDTVRMAACAAALDTFMRAGRRGGNDRRGHFF